MSNLLLLAGLVLIGLKFFGLKERLREIGRVVDRIVNVLLAIIIVMYVVQVAFLLFQK